MEVTNRALESILTKVVSSNRKDWVERLVEATWAYNTTWKTTTVFTPYELVYGKKALLSIEFEYNTLRMVVKLDLDLSHAQKKRLFQLNGLDEFRCGPSYILLGPYTTSVTPYCYYYNPLIIFVCPCSPHIVIIVPHGSPLLLLLCPYIFIIMLALIIL